jgi:hypothetical protein
VARKVNSPECREDVPANASDLRTPEEIELELARERLRFVQEERKKFRYLNVGFVVVLTILVLGAALSGATALVGVAGGDHSLVAPSLSAMFGSGAGGIALWRLYAGWMPIKGATG